MANKSVEDFHQKVTESVQLFHSCLLERSLPSCVYNTSLSNTMPVSGSFPSSAQFTRTVWILVYLGIKSVERFSSFLWVRAQHLTVVSVLCRPLVDAGPLWRFTDLLLILKASVVSSVGFYWLFIWIFYLKQTETLRVLFYANHEPSVSVSIWILAKVVAPVQILKPILTDTAALWLYVPGKWHVCM